MSPEMGAVSSIDREGSINRVGYSVSPEISEVRNSQWWQEAVAYQIYPASFRDSNGDGIGDLRGIIQSLDYLQHLGVKMLWLSPIYPSPMRDGGYDVADYKNIDPRFGSLPDFDELVRQADARGQRIIMDLVMNHSSSEHPWFKESASSRENRRRDWYIWADPKADGSPPNNWQSFFGGSAWAYDDRTHQYYLHKFDITQPDLNMRNPGVRDATKGIMRFWLDLGIGGFRMDVLDHIFEDRTLADARLNPDYKQGDPKIERTHWRERYFQYPEVYDWTREIMKLVHEYNAVGIGEIGSNDVGHVASLHAAGLDLPFNFRLLNVPFKAPSVRHEVETYLNSLPKGAWPNFVLENHDNRRLASKVGEEKVPVATTLLLTLPGTPFIYYGEEIGMEDGAITPLQNKDPQGSNDRLGIEASRDPARTPMQWDASESAGFSTARSDVLWLPVGHNRDGRNVAEQMENPNSLLQLTRKIIHLRQTNSALLHGAYVPLSTDPDVYVYGRQAENQRVIVALNFSGTQQVLAMPENSSGTVLISSLGGEGRTVAKELKLQPYEACILDTN